jgi:hypothetical protein
MTAIVFLCVALGVSFRIDARREVEGGLYVLADNVRFTDP